MTLVIGSIQLGLLYALMSIGLYITFRILDISDLTVEGSFTLGMAVAVVFTANSHPFAAMIMAAIAGSAAGTVTGILHTKIGIHPILAGILVMTSLYTVNLAIMGGKSNISIVGKPTLFSMAENLVKTDWGLGKTLVGLIFCVLVIIIFAVLFKTRLGFAIRATGDNEDMVRASSVNADFIKCLGLALGNACVALSGALICQYQLFSDVTSGIGIVVIGLASVIIGETLIGKHSVTVGLISVAIGSVIYRIIIAFAFKFNLFPSYALKLISAIIVTIALSLPAIKLNIQKAKARREIKNNVDS